ncbi:MAG: flagellar biosynthetic protein FliR, partial [Granulosicoccus sp.]|nr:flagellar biosynthetic protein FliR [Granulosicoccus sp.]
ARIRIALALVITLLIVPSLDPMPVLDPLSLDSVIISVQQLIIGVGMGLIVLIVFNAVTMAGEAIAITMGLGFALMNDPQNGAQVPTVSQFYLILATLLFLSLDGHHAVFVLLNDSFTLMPVGKALQADSFWQISQWGSTVFFGALSIALPALAAMLTANIIMGVMTRAAPQLNLFSVGFPITMTVGFIAILYTLPVFQDVFDNLLVLAGEAIARLVRS